ncbi:hypothetical protein PENVUL_c005G07018 [Penicillium vulpinum]|uniref:Uncharacterized protein n=1 Tax=Penicillium vulpinum TaxID=29845 RepID=A0A1V6S789_9EURO|nr:hypothetical protein PENVUL_c005G07018 [Penicillium vulpinum]
MFTCLVSLFVGMAVGVGLANIFNPTVQLVANTVAKASLSPPEVNVNSEFVFNPETGEAKCGTHWTEAKRLGCQFDVMASRWYSPKCFNQDVLHEMLQEVDFKWYADREHTKEVSRDVALAGEFEALAHTANMKVFTTLMLLSIGVSQTMGLVIPRAMAVGPVAEEAVTDYDRK